MQTTLGNRFGLQIASKQRKAPLNSRINKQFNTLIWALMGPLLVMPGYTDMPIPDNIKHRISIERLLLVAKQEPMASEVETMWYLSTASLRAPLGRDWVDIFLYLTRKFMLAQHKELLDFLREQIELNDLQEQDLKRLRNWLFERSFKQVHKRVKNCA